MSPDERFMQAALENAARAGEQGEVPVGAVVVLGDEIVGTGANCPVGTQDPTAHAEMLALRDAAARRQNYRLSDCEMYVTLEPCAMCMGALLNARVRRLVFGAWDAKAGACGSVLDLSRSAGLPYRIDVFGGVSSEASKALLKGFFERRR